jgi:hypothetical protein
VLALRYRQFLPVLLATGLALNTFLAWRDRDLVRKGYQDFTAYYAAGKIVRAGMAPSLYDQGLQFRVQREFAPDVIIRHGPLPYIHPPFEALLFVPLTFLPYFTAYLVWDALSAAMLVVMLVLLRPHIPLLRKSFAICTVAVFVYFPAFVCLLQGQDMIIVLLLLALVYSSIEKGRYAQAGLWLGAGVFRPHLVLPVVLILLFDRRFRSVLGFACSALAASLISIATVGWRGFLEYPNYVWQLEQHLGRGAILPTAMPNLRGFVAIFTRDGYPLSLVLTFAGSLFLLILAIHLFRRAEHPERLDLAFSVAVLVSVLVSYHAFMYDLSLLLLPVLFLVNLAVSKNGDMHWSSALPIALLFFTPFLMLLALGLGRLNFLVPVLLLWLSGIRREIVRLHVDHRLAQSA